MIDFNNVTFGYKKGVSTIDGITFNVNEGQTLGLLGHNGAGKTTTLRLILGILQTRTGYIRIGGFKPGSKDMPRSFISYMPESVGIYDKLTGFQNLEFRARVARTIPEQIRAISEKLLRRLGLINRGNDKAGYYSKGMKQRLSLACSLICNPKVLLLDEPTNGIDPESLLIVTQILQEVRATGTTVIMSSHDLNSVFKLCDYIAILQEGKMPYTGVLPQKVNQLQKIYLKITKKDTKKDE